MNAKNKFVIIGIIVIVIMFVIFFVYYNTIGNYGFIVKINWNIKIPNCDKTIYYIDSGPSFNGDGERFSILEYKSSDKKRRLKQLTWETDKLDDKIVDIMDQLEIEKNYYPDLSANYKWIYMKKRDSSEIWLLYFEKTNRIYVIENTM